MSKALLYMVLTLDDSSEHVAHGPFRKKIGFDDSFDVTKCLKQIEYNMVFRFNLISMKCTEGILAIRILRIILDHRVSPV